MNTTNIYPIEEIESLLIEGTKSVYVINTTYEEMNRVRELCDYYGYMDLTTSWVNVSQLVKVRGGPTQ